MALSFASALAAGDGESSAVAAMAGASVLKMGRFQVGGAKLPWFLATVPLLSMQSLWKQVCRRCLHSGQRLHSLCRSALVSTGFHRGRPQLLALGFNAGLLLHCQCWDGCSLCWWRRPHLRLLFLGVNPADDTEVLLYVAVFCLEGSSNLFCGLPRKWVIFPSQMHLTIKANKSIVWGKN